jgi:hypothetical protein
VRVPALIGVELRSNRSSRRTLNCWVLYTDGTVMNLAKWAVRVSHPLRE